MRSLYFYEFDTPSWEHRVIVDVGGTDQRPVYQVKWGDQRPGVWKYSDVEIEEETGNTLRARVDCEGKKYTLVYVKDSNCLRVFGEIGGRFQKLFDDYPYETKKY